MYRLEKEQFLKKYNEAPRLIPVYNHRYMPNIDKKRVPILSVVGSDIIVYGKDLQDYLEREFELIKKNNIMIINMILNFGAKYVKNFKW